MCADAVRERRQTEFAIDLDAREFKFGGDAQTAKLFDSLDVRLRTAQFDEESEADGRVRFYPDGSSSGGRVILHDGQNTYAIGVEWLNGRVKIAEADFHSPVTTVSAGLSGNIENDAILEAVVWLTPEGDRPFRIVDWYIGPRTPAATE